MSGHLDVNPWPAARLTPDERAELRSRVPEGMTLNLSARSGAGPFCGTLFREGRIRVGVHEWSRTGPYAAGIAALGHVELLTVTVDGQGFIRDMSEVPS